MFLHPRLLSHTLDRTALGRPPIPDITTAEIERRYQAALRVLKASGKYRITPESAHERRGEPTYRLRADE